MPENIVDMSLWINEKHPWGNKQITLYIYSDPCILCVVLAGFWYEGKGGGGCGWLVDRSNLEELYIT